MPFNWNDFLDLAENIAPAASHVEPREAACRSAVSRAYYSAFHAAVQLGKRSGFKTTGSGNDHPGIQKHFLQKKHIHPKISSLSLQLNRLLNLRHKADYDDVIRETPEHMAQNAIGIAKLIFSTISEINQ